MLPRSFAVFFTSPESIDAIEGLAVAIAIALLAALWYYRERRNSVLEAMIAQKDFGPNIAFLGTLDVEEHKPGVFLKLVKRTKAARRAQLLNRIMGNGPQAFNDEVIIDGSRQVVDIKKRDKTTPTNFSLYSAVRMREVAGSKGSGSVWHVELVPTQGRPKPFVTSVRGDRRTSFEHTAPIARAVSKIMAIPVQVVVAGNVWTPGWPPKSPISSQF